MSSEPEDGRASEPEDARLVPRLPGPFGYPAALETIGTSAAAMLAGFAFVLIGLILQEPSRMAQPNVALVLLVGAALLLVHAVQFSFKARQHHLPLDEYVSLLDIAKREGLEDSVRAQHSKWAGEYRKWAKHTRLAYNSGVVVLLSGVTIALIPAGPLDEVSPLRLVAAGLAAAGAAIEARATLREDLGRLRTGLKGFLARSRALFPASR